MLEELLPSSLARFGVGSMGKLLTVQRELKAWLMKDFYLSTDLIFCILYHDLLKNRQ